MYIELKFFELIQDEIGALKSPYKYTRTECQGVIDTKVENHDFISTLERNKFVDFFYKIVNSIVNFFKKLFS